MNSQPGKEMQTLKEEIDVYKAKNHGLDKQYKELSAKYEVLCKSERRYERFMAEDRKRIDELKSENESLQLKILNIEGEREDLSVKADQSKKGSHYHLEETLKQKDEIIRENVEIFESEKRHLTDQIRQLTEERDDLNRRMKEISDQLIEKDEQVKQLNKQITEMKKDKQYCNQHEEYQAKVCNTSDEVLQDDVSEGNVTIAELTKERNELQASMKDQSGQLKDKEEIVEQLEKHIKEMDRSHELIMREKHKEHSNQMYEYQSIIENKEQNYMQTLHVKERKLYEMNANIAELKEKCTKAKEIINKLQDDVCERDVTIKVQTKKINELQTRYRQISSENLNENNPDIVDLSDPNRTMKLAERFGDIYNESWTDAYEALDNLKYQDKDSVGFLLYGLTKCFEYCTTKANSQLESLKNLLLYPDQNTGQQVKQSFPSWLIQYGRADKKMVEASKKYLFECTHMCWLMVLHDPPLVIRTDAKAGVKVDTNLYTTMSKGDIVEYLVWPPLYNGQSGGLLNKGVVVVKKMLTKKGK